MSDLWVCYTAIINILIFQCGDRLSTSEYDVYLSLIMTTKDGPRTKRVDCMISGIIYHYLQRLI